MRHALPEGGLVRKLWVGEADAYRNHLLRLDAESRRSRFSGVVSDEFIRRYADSLITLKAVIYGFFADGCLRGVAEPRPLGVAGEAEAALSVEKAWQRRGVAAALLERTLLTARNRGFKRVRVVLRGRQRTHAAACP
jgi:GNAT superfamily N-acetyltransferase